MRSSGLRLGAAVLLAVLAGCRSAPPPAPESWSVRRPQLQARQHFVLKGRVAVAASGEGFNASLRWLQNGSRSQLTLEGPLGAGATEITVAGDDLQLVTSRGESISSAAARAELEARFGFDPPLASLRFWVLGVPDPDAPATETLDTAGERLSALTQAGWHVDYLGYAAVHGEWLPARLTLEREAVRVRLLVSDWQQ